MSSTAKETEITLYAHIEDPESLLEADVIEDHIQFESTLISGARMRVRKITPVKGPNQGGADRYEITMKVPNGLQGGLSSSNETTQETDRGFFEAFAEVSNRGIVKRRHVFVSNAPTISGVKEGVVLPAVKYEVDQFTNPNTGEKSEWIKIDIEIDGLLDALESQGIETSGVKQKFDLAALPFRGTEIFSAKTATPEQKEILGKLWETEFAKKVAPDTYQEVKAEDTPAAEPVEETATDEEVTDASSEEAEEAPKDTPTEEPDDNEEERADQQE